MKVRQLIEKLQKATQDADVLLWDEETQDWITILDIEEEDREGDGTAPEVFFISSSYARSGG